MVRQRFVDLHQRDRRGTYEDESVDACGTLDACSN
jgi:hypothetical protein